MKTDPWHPLRRALAAAGMLAATALLTACPAPPPYPYWGPFGSEQGVTNAAIARSAALEQYVKDYLDGRVPAQIPANLLPDALDIGVDPASFYIQLPHEVDPETQWGTRLAHEIDWDATYGAFPDPHASYLVMPHMVAPFGSKIIITGEFPRARYFSIQGTPSFKGLNYRYQGIGHGEVAWVDADIVPDPGHTNPYQVGANRSAANRSFTITCDSAVGDPMVLDAAAWASPAYRDPGNNHRHCSGLVYRGPWGDPNYTDANGSTAPDRRGYFDAGWFWIRVYARDHGTDVWGDMPKPKVLYQLPDGRQYFINGDFSAMNARTDLTRPLLVEPGREPNANWGDGYGWSKQFSIFRQIAIGATHDNSYPSANLADQQQYIRNLDLGVEARGENAPSIMREEPHSTAGVHINYLTRGTCLPNGEVFTISGKLPTTPDTRGGAATMTAAQARYLSFTGYSPKWDANDPSYVAGAVMSSLMDDEIVTDAQGNYLLVYGRAEDRPANATVANGVTWVPWAREACQSFTLRWLSIAPEWSFEKAIDFENLGWESDFAAAVADFSVISRNHRRGFLAEYQPILGSYKKQDFEALGSNLQPQDFDLALDQPASATTSCCGGSVAHLVDGLDATNWQSNWWAGKTYAGVDTGSVRTIDRVKINWHTNGHARDYKVQVSNNNSTWTTVYTKVNGVGGIGGVESIPLSGVSGRYVRLEMTRRNALNYRIEEFEVWGR